MRRLVIGLLFTTFLVAAVDSAIISPLPFIFQNGAVADATQVNSDLSQIVTQVNANAAPLSSAYTPTVPNIQSSFVHGTGTYTTPTSGSGALPLYIKVYLWGAGGGGGGSGETGGGNGAAGTNNTAFGASLAAAPGHGGLGNGGVGTGGSGAGGSCSIDIAGQNGGGGIAIPSAMNFSGFPILPGGEGGGSYAIPSTPGKSGARQQGLFGSGGTGGGWTGDNTVSNANAGGGGGGGEYCYTIITSPAASYAWTVGTAGTQGSAGTGGSIGANGLDGAWIAEAYWQ